jgi:hypothetical protein
VRFLPVRGWKLGESRLTELSHSLICTGTAPLSRPPGATNLPAVSFVPNNYFPFPYIATSFENGAACSSAVGSCSRNYASCLSQLDGSSGFQVTIAVPGPGGTTVDPLRPTLGPSATSVCASLSSKACFNLESAQCSQGTAANGIVIGSGGRIRPQYLGLAVVFATLFSSWT